MEKQITKTGLETYRRITKNNSRIVGEFNDYVLYVVEGDKNVVHVDMKEGFTFDEESILSKIIIDHVQMYMENEYKNLGVSLRELISDLNNLLIVEAVWY